MNLKKLFSLLLAGLLTCNMLIACSTNDEFDWSEDEEEEENVEDREDSAENTDDRNDNVEDETEEDTSTPEHSHAWSEWEVTLEPSCSENGEATRFCDCGETENRMLNKTAHSEGEWIIIKKPTATTEGERGLVCAICGEYIKREPFNEPNAEWTYNTDNAGYCSGYSWANGVYCDVILDSFGEIVYAAANGEEIEIYANGYFISNLNGVQYLKKADGTIVYSTESLEVTGFGLTENTDDYQQFLHDGYVFVYKYINSYADSITQVGILDTDGNWIVPLSEDNPILTSDIPYFEKFYTAHWHYYVGDGILVLQHYDAPYHVVLYNIKDNAIYELSSNEILSYDTDYLLTTAYFQNGVAYVSSGAAVYKFYSNGKITRTNLDTKFHDFYVDEFGNYYSITNSAICLNGTPYVDLDFNIADAAWTGNAWLTLIKNSGGVYYYTYMTLDGGFLFEPVQTDAVYICDVSGISVGELYDSGIKLVIDQTNNIFYTSADPEAEIYLNKGVVFEQRKYAFSADETYTFLPKV